MTSRLLRSLSVGLFLLVSSCALFQDDDKERDYVPEYVAEFKETTVKHLVLSDKMSPEKQEEMAAAAFAWEVAVSGECSIHFEITVAAVDDSNPPKDVITVREEPLEDYAGYAWWGLPGGRIQMDTSLDISSFNVVAKHEIGHTLTLNHEGDGIMTGRGVITKSDASLVCERLNEGGLSSTLTPSATSPVGHSAP